MKKQILLAVVAIMALGFVATAQQVDRSSFKAGVFAGIPVGDYSDFSSFGLGLDLAHHWSVSELFDLGLASGYIHAFGESDTVAGGTIGYSFEDIQFIPVAGAIRMYPTYQFKLGADIGYAVGVNEENDGGFYLRPSIGYNITGNTELNASYITISNNGASFSMVALGLLFLF
ncbi:hypothetical protein [Flagellimonas zhangzhouensis]|uniref:Outer membrane protein beta-barrel domain-containing protein n=1 Tax=Flagellimonas zhangzhouensis TaxID=1073328 RepID=A0A1H2XYV5_9FLAO|nr:hypothetical protein [Allomuricauda zhangzhouensis]SDQ93225.1 hypothetical protein SAMN05216294_2895 [Allomuricauda zhangzhouensis]SDW97905.1 hypothetical protein SAMN04487892_2887 [Allomuricauda zhangzhouensis]